MNVKELKEFLQDKDDLSEILVDTFEVQKEKTSIFQIKEIFEQNYEGMAISHNDIIIVL